MCVFVLALGVFNFGIKFNCGAPELNWVKLHMHTNINQVINNNQDNTFYVQNNKITFLQLRTSLLVDDDQRRTQTDIRFRICKLSPNVFFIAARVLKLDAGASLNLAQQESQFHLDNENGLKGRHTVGPTRAAV